MTGFTAVPDSPVLAVGEGPRWDVALGTLTWFDMVDGRVLRLCDGTIEELARCDTTLGCTATHADGSLLGATPDGIVTLIDAAGNPVQDPTPLIAVGSPVAQLNDGKCDRRGRLWVGAVGIDEPGSLLRLGARPQLDVVRGGYLLPNGMDWTNDDRYLLHADSRAHRIYRYEFDLEAGELGDRTTWWQGRPEDGMPDGLCVGDDDSVWVAFWGSGAVRHLTRSGVVQQELRLPVSQATSVCFGGPDLTTLYATTACAGLSREQRLAEPLAGVLFQLPGAGQGRSSHAARFPVPMV